MSCSQNVVSNSGIVGHGMGPHHDEHGSVMLSVYTAARLVLRRCARAFMRSQIAVVKRGPRPFLSPLRIAKTVLATRDSGHLCVEDDDLAVSTQTANAQAASLGLRRTESGAPKPPGKTLEIYRNSLACSVFFKGVSGSLPRKEYAPFTRRLVPIFRYKESLARGVFPVYTPDELCSNLPEHWRLLTPARVPSKNKNKDYIYIYIYTTL